MHTLQGVYLWEIASFLLLAIWLLLKYLQPSLWYLDPVLVTYTVYEFEIPLLVVAVEGEAEVAVVCVVVDVDKLLFLLLINSWFSSLTAFNSFSTK